VRGSKSKIGILSERLSKYLDRPIVDYWRTVQGVNVGFRGNPGQGIPIAGPPTLTGGAGAANPLLKPLLKKYKKGTFIGDAIRKKNFPLSTINFIEQIVGGSEEEIRAKFDQVRKEIDFDGEAKVREIVTGVLGTPGSEKFDKFVKVFGESLREGLSKADAVADEDEEDGLRLARIEAVSEKIGAPHRVWRSFNLINDPERIFEDPLAFDPSNEEDVREMATDFYNYLTTGEGTGAFTGLNGISRSPDADMSREYGSPGDAFRVRRGSLRMQAVNSALKKVDSGYVEEDSKLLISDLSMTEEKRRKSYARSWIKDRHKTVFGVFNDHFDYPSAKASILYDYLRSLGVAGTVGPKDLAKTEGLSDLGVSEKDVNSFFADFYVANQILMPDGDYIELTRGLGSKIPGMGNSHQAESDLLLKEIEDEGVPVRLSGQRSVSGFAEGGESRFKGVSIVGLEVPKEAVLSAFSGLSPQESVFDFEKETLVIGAAEIAVPASKIKKV
jgi:hypothetical protein